MPSDRTRTSDDLRQRYKAVVMQQGRVTLDRDFNALQGIVEGQIAADALDEIGPCGTPDDGFAITLPTPAEAAAFSSHFSTPDFWDFIIGPGTMYVGGQRVELPAPASNQPDWSYFHQPDWPNPTPPVFAEGSQSTPPNEYVFLHVYEQEVGAVEDGDLLDVALGGPDTTQRVRLMWRAIRVPTDATDCPTALAEASADWAAHGFQFDPKTMRRLPQARLQVGFTATRATSTPCDPVEQGGYLGAENQLIRLQIGESAAGKPQLLWGFDDASFLYRIGHQPDKSTVLLDQVPVDAYHSPTQGQVVEVLRSATILGTEPDSTGATPITRCVAETSGFVTTVKSYSNSDNTVTLVSPLPAAYLSDTNPQFLRIWQGQQPIVLSTQPITLNDPTTNTSPGIQVTITVPDGGPKGASLPVGAYWMIAARPSTPQLVYPERFLAAPQLPDGPREWICPLAVIEWARDDFASIPSRSFRASAKIIDCRQGFSNLVTLSKRRQAGCCSVSVAPSDAPNLQAILDKAASNDFRATVCFSPGTYSLAGPLRLSTRHSGLILEACGGDVTIQPGPNADRTGFLDGLIVLALANDVTLKDLTFLPPSVPIQQATQTPGAVANLAILESTSDSSRTIVGIRVFQCLRVNIEGCSIQLAPEVFLPTTGYGIFLSGDCTGLSIKGCDITSTIPPTVTLPRIFEAVALADQESRPIATGPDTAIPAPAPSIATGSALPLAAPASIPVSVSTDLVTEAITPRGFVALFGVFADSARQAIGLGGTLSELTRVFILPNVLHTGRLIDNTFSNLTMAVRFLSALGTCRIENNRATECFAGFSLEASDFVTPTAGPNDPNAASFNATLANALSSALDFPEISSGESISGLLPFPSGISPAEFRILSAQKSSRPPIFLTFSSNHVEATISSAKGQGGAAILFRLNRSVTNGEDTSSSLIMEANLIKGSPAIIFQLPLALVLPGGPTALTGNVISSSGRGDLGLAIFPPGGFGPASGLAVTGNVLIGETNLENIIRVNAPAAPFNTWVPFNSIS